jgi:hypothetical protein
MGLILTLYLQEDLQKELADLEQDELNERLAGADHVPVHTPAGAIREPCTCMYTSLE